MKGNIIIISDIEKTLVYLRNQRKEQELEKISNFQLWISPFLLCIYINQELKYS